MGPRGSCGVKDYALFLYRAAANRPTARTPAERRTISQDDPSLCVCAGKGKSVAPSPLGEKSPKEPACGMVPKSGIDSPPEPGLGKSFAPVS